MNDAVSKFRNENTLKIKVYTKLIKPAITTAKKSIYMHKHFHNLNFQMADKIDVTLFTHDFIYNATLPWIE